MEHEPEGAVPDMGAAPGGAVLPASPPLQVTYYTDPLCSWSWALEPQWRRLRHELAGRIGWRYVMGGMIPDWETFKDPLHSIARPAQMGPQWYQVRHLSGMPIEDRIWLEDPPASSYPACLAVKAAERQGAEAGEAMLRRLREAVLAERRNVARPEVLLAVAEEAGLDTGRFEIDLESPETLDAFRDDLKDIRYRSIGRFPTLVLQGPLGAVIVVGYRPYPVLLEALARIAPDEPRAQAGDPVEYARRWESVTAREAAEAIGAPPETAEGLLQAAADRGDLIRSGHLYRIRSGRQ